MNIQGDEPLVTPDHIRLLVGPFRERPDTAGEHAQDPAHPGGGSNPNVNKVVCGVDGRALYFSKYPIPYDRDGIGVVRYKHAGFYAYRKAALDAFHRLPPSPLELTEKLEQLAFLENGIDIIVVETTPRRSAWTRKPICRPSPRSWPTSVLAERPGRRAVAGYADGRSETMVIRFFVTGFTGDRGWH